MRLSLFFIAVSFAVCNAQSSKFTNVAVDLRHNLLDSIAKRQIKSDPFYSAGLFSCQRTNRKGSHPVEDNNIFFTGLTVYTLQSLRHYLSVEDQTTIDSISTKSKKTFPVYQNRKGGVTYNFYQVHPEKPFPHLKTFIAKWGSLKLADDLDDTSILYLAQSSSDSLNNVVKDKMRKQSLIHKKVKSTFKPYRSSLAYRTWFSENMKQDLDVCVIGNVLTFVFQKNLTLDSIDLKSMELIRQIVLSNQHIKYPQFVSPHYQNSSIILYHLARLLSSANHTLLNSLREKIISDLQLQLKSSKNEMEKIILLTSLYRLNQKTDFGISVDDLKKDMPQFYWFRANPFSTSPFWIKKILGNSNFLHLKYKSEAYNLSLILELSCLSQAEMRARHLISTTTK